MEITVVADKLPSVSLPAKNQSQSSSKTDFNTVLGKVMDSSKAETGSSSKKVDKHKKKNKEKTETVADTNTTAKNAIACVVDDSAAVELQDSASDGQQQGQQQGQQPAETVQTAVSNVSVPASDTLTEQPVSGEKSATVSKEQFVANVKAQLQKNAENLQTTTQKTAADPAVEQTDAAVVGEEAKTALEVQTSATANNQVNAAAQQTLDTATEQTADVAVQHGDQAGKKIESHLTQDQSSADQTAETPAVSTLSAAEPEKEQSGGNFQSDQMNSDKGKDTQAAQSSKTEQVKNSSSSVFSTAVNVQSAQQTEENTEIKEAVNRALNQFEKDFQGVTSDNQTIQIALRPKELGTLSITLSAALNGVSAKIRTNNAEAASLLSGQIQHMVQTMEAKGVRVQNVEVICNQMSQQNFSGGGSGNAGQYERQTASFIPLFSTSKSSKSSALSNYENMTECYATGQDSGQRVEYRV